MFKIKNLNVSINNKDILKNLNFNIRKGELHALIGPNGSGKTTLVNALAGKKEYTTSGSIELQKNELSLLQTDERARAGLFVSFQTPPSIPGITNFQLVRCSAPTNNIKTDIPDVRQTLTKYNNDIETLQLKGDWAKRHFNDGASGGERKKNELLQLLQLNPKVIILDELDSGLDIDALKIVTTIIQKHRSKYGWLIISHSSSILKKLKPTHVHIIKNGSIASCGGVTLLTKVDNEGFKNV